MPRRPARDNGLKIIGSQCSPVETRKVTTINPAIAILHGSEKTVRLTIGYYLILPGTTSKKEFHTY